MDGAGKIFVCFCLMATTAHAYNFYKLSISIKKNKVWYSFLGFLTGIAFLVLPIIVIYLTEKFVLKKLFDYTVINFGYLRWIYMLFIISMSVTFLLVLKNVFSKKIVSSKPTNEIEEIGFKS